MTAWRSPSASGPPSMETSSGIGYGPASLSSSYSKSTVDSGVEESTTVIGMPIGPPSQRPEPKSAWTWRFAPMALTIRFELLRMGNLSTRLFQTLSAGKIAQSGAPGSGSAEAGAARARAVSAAPHPRPSFTLPVSGHPRRGLEEPASFRVSAWRRSSVGSTLSPVETRTPLSRAGSAPYRSPPRWRRPCESADGRSTRRRRRTGVRPESAA